MKLKVYIMHSEKIDYNNEIYNPLLEKGILDKYNIILPLSEKYKTTYIKELLNESDIIICNLTKFNLLSNIELKMATKTNKKIYYFINEQDKKINKYKNLEVEKYKDKNEFVNLVIKILDSLNHQELLLKRDNIFCLGKIVKNKYN